MRLCLVISCAILSVASGATNRAISWNSLLRSDDDLIPSNYDRVNMSPSPLYKMTVLSQLKTMLDNSTILTEIYGRYLKSYNKEEGRQSAAIFAQNLLAVAQHNVEYDAGRSPWYKGVNKFTDMSDHELMPYAGAAAAPLDTNSTNQLETGPSEFLLSQLKAPDSLDWRQQGIVTPVKDQGRCGSCWAFASVAALEAAVKKINGRESILSEQEMVDCDKKQRACQSGWIEKAFDYLKRQGVMSSADYPYQGTEQSCRRGQNKAAAWAGAYSQVRGEAKIKDAVAQYGLVAIGVDLHGDFYSYKGGIYDKGCGGNGGHFMAIAGYGNEGGKDYWIIKNSWGQRWGESGYMKLIRGKDKCGVGSRNGGWFISK